MTNFKDSKKSIKLNENDLLNLRQRLLRLILPKIIEIIDKNLIKDIQEIIEKNIVKFVMSGNKIDFNDVLTSN
jgi:hypothetical protein